MNLTNNVNKSRQQEQRTEAQGAWKSEDKDGKPFWDNGDVEDQAKPVNSSKIDWCESPAWSQWIKLTVVYPPYCAIVLCLDDI